MCQGMSNANDNKIVHQNIVQNHMANNASGVNKRLQIYLLKHIQAEVILLLLHNFALQ